MPDRRLPDAPSSWGLVIPNTKRALGSSTSSDSTQRPTERIGQLILRAVMLAGGLLVGIAIALPITRTVELNGQLVPERVVSIRSEEPGLLSEIQVVAGDTVRPGALVARLRSRELEEATRLSPEYGPALLARRRRLDVYAPPWSERRLDGSHITSTIWRGGIVLTEDLEERRGASVDAGDVILALAAIGSDGRVGYVVRAWAREKDAQRVRPGMTARVTFTAFPQERRRQVTGTVIRVSLTPDAKAARGPDEPKELTGGEWRVDISMAPDVLRTVLQSPAELRAGFSTEVAVRERRETLATTALNWVRARWEER